MLDSPDVLDASDDELETSELEVLRPEVAELSPEPELEHPPDELDEHNSAGWASRNIGEDSAVTAPLTM